MWAETKNGSRFDALLQEYERDVLQGAADDEKHFEQARIWMAERWPLTQTRYATALRCPAFLRIADGERTVFGGNQAWYASSHHRNAGCGTVAIADITAYAGLCGEVPVLYAGQGSLAHLTRGGFLQHMDAVIEELYPTPLGIPCVPYLMRGTERYARSRSCEVASWHCLHGRRNTPARQLEAEAFLQFQIRNNRPVACIHWGGVKNIRVLNPTDVPEGEISDMNWHWVVITGIERDENGAQLTISSCGWRYVFALDEFLCGSPSFVTAAFRAVEDAARVEAGAAETAV